MILVGQVCVLVYSHLHASLAFKLKWNEKENWPSKQSVSVTVVRVEGLTISEKKRSDEEKCLHLADDRRNSNSPARRKERIS